MRARLLAFVATQLGLIGVAGYAVHAGCWMVAVLGVLVVAVRKAPEW